MSDIHAQFNHLTPESTLADLPVSACRLNADVQGHRVGQELEQDPELPGVLIMDGRKLLGMISRERYLEHLSRPFALELYSKRPVALLLQAMQLKPLLLPAAHGVHGSYIHI